MYVFADGVERLLLLQQILGLSALHKDYGGASVAFPLALGVGGTLEAILQ